MEIQNQVSVQLKFTIKNGDHELTDALYFPSIENFQTYTLEQLDAMKLERFNNWVNAINAPPPPPLVDPLNDLNQDPNGIV